MIRLWSFCSRFLEVLTRRWAESASHRRVAVLGMECSVAGMDAACLLIQKVQKEPSLQEMSATPI